MKEYLLHPDFKRLYKLIFLKNKYSLTRNLQYEILSKLKISGKILDFGGGENVDYRDLFRNNNYYSVNIDERMKPTWLVKVKELIPCNNNSFNFVVSMNTLEHIYEPKFVLAELYRILKNKGEIILSTPFLFRVHAHPDDYFRPTPSWYKETLKDIGFKNIKIIPLFWGPFSTGAICSGLPGPLRSLRMAIALILDYFLFKIKKIMSKNHLNTNNGDSSLAFFVLAKK